MIKIISGNILNTTEDIILQQVNCQGRMASGLAKDIKNTYPEVCDEYIDLFKSKSNVDLLGTVQFVKCRDGKIVANLFGQFYYGTDKRHTDYDALKSCFNYINNQVKDNSSKLYGKTIAIPYNIGCGLGGGDWNIVYKIIEEVFGDYDITIYKL